MKTKRFDLFFVLFILTIGVFIYKLYDYQIVNTDKYSEQVESISRRSISLLPQRGMILDRNGIPLAWDAPYYNIEKKVVFLPNDLERMMVNAFDDKQKAEMLVRNLEIFGSVETNLPAALAERLNDFPELEVSERVIRYYQNNPGVAHVVGYIKADGEPVMGIERQYNDLLRGTPGEKLIRVDALGRQISLEGERPPVGGEDLTITIDSQMSKYIYELINETGKSGAAVVMTTSGELLALVSVPGFENMSFTRGISNRDWERLNLDPSRPLVNRALTPFTPGSVIKPFIAMVALAEGKDTTEQIDCRGSFQYKDSQGVVQGVYRDWNLYGHGMTDLSKAITVSCNVYFYQLGLELEIDTINNYAEIWEVFEPTNIDLPEESIGLMPSPSWKQEKLEENWFPGDTIQISIGQGYLSITPLQLAKMTGEIATKGREILPYIGFERESDRTVIELGENDWSLLREALGNVISKGGGAAEAGTAYSAFRNFEETAAGKTGTAEQGGSKPTHSWFTGFMPLEEPEIVVTVFVHEGGYGSGLASQISRKIMDYYLQEYINQNHSSGLTKLSSSPDL
ncbi:MAG: cell division protein FtsI [Kosmotogaceae bacterium]|nr:cell division protein FtsI [Kosmotogaceae bacterium]